MLYELCLEHRIIVKLLIWIWFNSSPAYYNFDAGLQIIEHCRGIPLMLRYQNLESATRTLANYKLPTNWKLVLLICKHCFVKRIHHSVERRLLMDAIQFVQVTSVIICLFDLTLSSPHSLLIKPFIVVKGCRFWDRRSTKRVLTLGISMTTCPSLLPEVLQSTFSTSDHLSVQLKRNIWPGCPAWTFCKWPLFIREDCFSLN